MSDPKGALVGVVFHRGSPPYEAGDVAGFPREQAQRYVDTGRAAFVGAGAAPAPDFAEMNRDQLLTYAREHLGLADTPPAEVTDDQLREAFRRQVSGEAEAAAPASTGKGKAPA